MNEDSSVDLDELELWTSSMQRQIGNSSTDEQPQEDEEILRHWRESPFAVGKTKITWADDDIGCKGCCGAWMSGNRRCHLHLSGLICGRCWCGRVGNLIIVKERTEDVKDRSGQKTGEQQRKLQCVIGPYWPMAAFITFPVVIGFSFLACYQKKLWNESLWKFLVWAVLNITVLFSLLMTSCSDPGVFYRHAELPAGEDPNTTDWRWSDQALTYRPANARFDRDTGVVISEFDHTCPWTGTAIGKNNIKWFRIFVPMVFFTLITDAVLIAWL